MGHDADWIVHRATYTLERGTWRGTCRVCGWEVTDPNRRRAAAQYRLHIQATAEASQREETSLHDEVVDVSERAIPDEYSSAMGDTPLYAP